MELEAASNSISHEPVPTSRLWCCETAHGSCKTRRSRAKSYGILGRFCSYPLWMCVSLWTLLVYLFLLVFRFTPMHLGEFRGTQDIEQCDTAFVSSLQQFLWFGAKAKTSCWKPKPSSACPNPVKLKFGVACQCTGHSCGDIPDVELSTLKAGHALVITSHSGKSTEFMVAEYVALNSSTQSIESTMSIDIDVTTKYQKIIGFGGAFTDAVAHNYAQLNPSVQRQFIRTHFGRNGAGYTLGRVHMNGCDFSRMDYTLDNVTDDYDLEHFCLRDDSAPNPSCGTDYKTTVIKAAQIAIRSVNSAGSLKLYVSSWSAPSWLKDQNFTCRIDHSSFYPTGTCSPGAARAAVSCTRNISWSETGATNSEWIDKINLKRSSRKSPMRNANGNCFNSGFLRSDARALQTWATFFLKFIESYKRMGVDIWGVTVQNEPLATTSLWSAMYYTADMQANFVAHYLGPTLRKHYPDMKIMIHDDDTESLLDFAGKILEDEAAATYIDGVAYHWYASIGGVYENDEAEGLIAKLAGKFFQFVVNRLGFTIPSAGGGAYVKEIWQQLQKQSIDKFVLPSEASNGANIGQRGWFGPSPGNWMYGYAYSHDVLWQLRNNAAGWTDWNLMLNEKGGPNTVGNFVDSAVTFMDESTFYQQPMFFHLAHFSKYILPGSVRIQANIECRARNRNWCQTVAFLTPQRNIVVVITNDELTGLPMGDVVKGLPIISRLTRPALAGGEGKDLSWTITHGRHAVSGTTPWKGIQTVILPCDNECEAVYI